MDTGFTQLTSEDRLAADSSYALSQLRQCEAEKRLLIAVLRDALYNYRKHRWSRGRRFTEAESWIFGADTDRLFAFNTVCDLLGLSAERIRKNLLREAPAGMDKLRPCAGR